MAAGRRFLVSAWFLVALAMLSCAAAEADDGDVLLEVKHAFAGDPEGVLAGWNASGAGAAAGFCAWAGVACDDAGLRVVGLNLSGAGLAGPVPRALARLDALEAIDLSANALTGPIPAALGGLASLQVLLLYSNQLTGEVPAALANPANDQSFLGNPGLCAAASMVGSLKGVRSCAAQP